MLCENTRQDLGTAELQTYAALCAVSFAKEIGIMEYAIPEGSTARLLARLLSELQKSLSNHSHLGACYRRSQGLFENNLVVVY